MKKAETSYYKHYRIEEWRGSVRVFLPSCFLNAIYECSTVAEAKKWISAYRDGVHWAMQASYPNKPLVG